MPEKLIDLHLHTRFSDGYFSPAETLALARERHLAAIAITDHDCLAAVEEAQKHDDDIEFISGVELSCHHENVDIHLLAYFVDHKYAPLASKVRFYQQERLKRGKLIVERLNELGVDLKMDTLVRVAHNAVISRAHVADALLKEEYVQTFDEAFSRYLGYHAPAYVPKTFFDPAEAIDLIHRAGGIAFIAHPGSTRKDDAIPRFKAVGLDGIEVYHSKHTPGQVRHYRQVAARYGLLISGGSDWHGRNDPKSEMGSQRLPYAILERMKEYLASRRA